MIRRFRRLPQYHLPELRGRHGLDNNERSKGPQITQITQIKAIANLTGLEEAQLINYLKACGFQIGLLINFGNKSLEHKRLVYNF